MVPYLVYAIKPILHALDGVVLSILDVLGFQHLFQPRHGAGSGSGVHQGGQSHNTHIQHNRHETTAAWKLCIAFVRYVTWLCLSLLPR